MIKGFALVLYRPKICFFYSKHRTEDLMVLSRQLLGRYRQFKPWKNVRLIHQLTLARYDPDLVLSSSKQQQQQRQVHEIINSMSGQLHTLSHKDVNILLEILKERSYKYTNELEIFRGINKQVKMMFGNRFKSEMLPRTLFFLKSLRFPKMTIIKLLQEYSNVFDGMLQQQEKQFVSLTELLRVCIFSFQQQYIPLPTVSKILKKVLKDNASTLPSLCALYHLTLIGSNCLDAKVEYEAMRITTRDTLFNPYQQLQNEEDETVREDNDKQSSRYIQIKKQLSDKARQILKLLTSSLDTKRLQSAIIRSVESDIEPFSKESIFYSCDIQELRPYIQGYLIENIQKLTPVELTYLAKRCKQGYQFIDMYLKKMEQMMSVQQRVYLLLEAHRLFHRNVTGQEIKAILASIDDISYEEFVAISRLVQLLPKTELKLVQQILRGIKQKMGDEDGTR